MFLASLYLLGVPTILFLKLLKSKTSFKDNKFLKDFGREYGNLIEGMKLRKDLLILVYPLLLLNRLIFAMIPFAIWNIPSL